MRDSGIVAASFCPMSDSGIFFPGSAITKNASARSGNTTSNQTLNPFDFPVAASVISFFSAVITSALRLKVTSQVPPVSCLPDAYCVMKSSSADTSICSVSREIPPMELHLFNQVNAVGFVPLAVSTP